MKMKKKKRKLKSRFVGFFSFLSPKHQLKFSIRRSVGEERAKNQPLSEIVNSRENYFSVLDLYFIG